MEEEVVAEAEEKLEEEAKWEVKGVEEVEVEVLEEDMV